MADALVVVACCALGYVLGSLPISAWLTRAARGRDIRAVGDGNPGAVNAWKAAGWKVGLAALVLDAAKGAVAPGLALWALGIRGWELTPIALSPPLGHATSPWLRGRGGKAITTTFGVWAALTTWVVPMAFGLSLAALMLVQEVPAWTVVLAGGVTIVLLLATRAVTSQFLVAFAASLLLLAWTHRHDLRSAPQFRLPVRRSR